MNPLTEPQKAYIAGIIDGEGCVTVGYRMIDGGRTCQGIKCIVASTDYPLLDWMSKTLGCGRIYKRYSRPGNLQGWNYILNGSMAEALYLEILPYLIIKKEQVLVSLELAENMRQPRENYRLNQEQKEARQAYADKIKALKYTAMVS